jgi:hypothetical protein
MTGYRMDADERAQINALVRRVVETGEAQQVSLRQRRIDRRQWAAAILLAAIILAVAGVLWFGVIQP